MSDTQFISVKGQSFQYGSHTVTLETGEIARQADAAVLVTMGDTVVLVTVVRKPAPGMDFFPLMVVYQERSYAGGRIPGGFIKREGRPSEHETLTSRLIDRPIRPLFADGYSDEVQIVATVLSSDPQVQADIPAMIGASAVCSLAGLPFEGPIGGARVGFIEGQYVLNPTPEQVKASALDLVVAGTQTSVLMVESEAKELSEEVMLGAVTFGHQQMQIVIEAIKALAADAGKPPIQWTAPAYPDELVAAIDQHYKSKIQEAYLIADKMQRLEAVGALRDQAIAQFAKDETAETPSADAKFDTSDVKDVFGKCEKKLVRERVLSGANRIDGRDRTTVRPINVRTTVLPRTHGSAIFTRGETQAIVVATLGAERDAQILDAMIGESRDTFMLNYNFPPYCVGETGMIGSPKRREIGHGWLAKRAIRGVLPDPETFPYVLRVVSEITESNGSSSMATVCGTSLALMDAGVPLKAPVAGIAMGLVKEDDKFAVLTDILGDEDHLGDMDFKVAGSAKGVTALQMDIKINGITEDIMQQALAQANAGRMHILQIMNAEINTHREDVSKHAPRILTMKIHPDKIRDVIGKGGATIRSITEETGVTIDIDDDGLVKIFAVDGGGAQAAIQRIEDLTAEVEIGKIYEGKVVKLADFGAFVAIMPDKTGLVHISQIADERVENVEDYLKEEQVVRVKVLDVDRQGRIRLSMKEVTDNPSEMA